MTYTPAEIYIEMADRASQKSREYYEKYIALPWYRFGAKDSAQWMALYYQEEATLYLAAARKCLREE